MAKKCFNSLKSEDIINFLDEHFSYEVDMIFFSLKKCIELGKTTENIPNKNMAIENFLLHARNLLEFFYQPHNKNEKCSYAGHFFNNEDDWGKICPNKTETIKQLEKRVHNEVTHLGYDRISGTPPEKSWDNQQLLKDFMAIIKIFIENTNDKYISEELRKKIQ